MENNKYSCIEQKIKEKYEEGNYLRTKFVWVGQRFQLEFGGIWEEKYASFLTQNEDSMQEGDIVLDESNFSDENIFEYIENSNIDETSVNEYWKKKAFIELLSKYRKNGSQDSNQSKQLINFASHINNDPLRYVYEIIQNADDCTYDNPKEEVPEFSIDLSKEGKMIVSYNEKGMTYSDIIALTTIGQSNKQKNKKKKQVGEKGIGFKTIFSVYQSVDIHSGGYHFKLGGNDFAPIKIEEDGYTKGTTLILNLKKDIEINGKDTVKTVSNELNNSNVLYNKLKGKYGLSIENGKIDKQNIFKNCPVMFTNQLQSIKVKKSDQEFTISCSEAFLIKYEVIESAENITEGEIKCHYAKKNVKLTYGEYCSRYPNQVQEDEFDDDVGTYPIYIVAPTDVSEIKEGNLYAYLPAYTNIKAPFNMQLPLKMNLDRSCMWFYGDQDTNGEIVGKPLDGEEADTILWNKRFVDEMFSTEDALIKTFYDDIKYEGNIFDYIPSFVKTNHDLFKSEESYAESIKKLNVYCKKLFDVFKKVKYFKGYGSDNYYNAAEAIMLDEFIMKQFNKVYFEKIKAKDKYLVEFNEKAEDKTSCFGFTLHSVEDELKIEYLNAVMEGSEDVVLKECQKEGGRSKYIPDTIEQLKMFPALNTNGKTRYTQLKENHWFKHRPNTDFASDHNICFLAKSIDYSGLIESKWFKFEQGENSSYTIGDIWDEMQKDIITENITKKLFIELMTFVATHSTKENDKDWYLYTKYVLENEEEQKSQKLWTSDRKKQLVKLINANIQRFIDEVGHMNNEAIQFHILGILAHSKKTSKENTESYLLPPIHLWNKEMCDVINSIKFGDEIKFKLEKEEVRRLVEISQQEGIKKIFEAFKDLCQVNQIYLANSNEWDNKVEFVRFTDTVILKEKSEECAKKCADSILQGLRLIPAFAEKSENILKNETKPFKDPEEAKDLCEEIKKICALQAHCTVNTRKVIGSDNKIIHELLQNANDRLLDGVIKITTDKEKMVLSYKEEGFSGKDFLAICTSGNSGNRSNGCGNSNIEATGYKGTGFKSIYNVFNKVVIKTNYVICTLDDTKKIKPKFKGDEISDIEYEEWKKEDKAKYFPVPHFEYTEDKHENTEMIFMFRDREKVKEFIQSNELDEETFKESKVFYFLRNIDKIDINDVPFDKKKYMSEHFLTYEVNGEDKSPYWEGDLDISKEDLKKNPRYKDISEDEFKKSSKNKMTMLFPNKKIPNETLLYCTLPILNEKLNMPVYINIPSLELEDSRNNISENEEVAEWNRIIQEKTLKGPSNHPLWEEMNASMNAPMNVFSKIFSRFAKSYPEIAYRYFPYQYNSEFECLYTIPFIRTVKEDKEAKEHELMSINQWSIWRFMLDDMYKDKEFIFLPDYMYQWFKEKKGLDGFKLKTPFVYYGINFDYPTLIKKIFSGINWEPDYETCIDEIGEDIYTGCFEEHYLEKIFHFLESKYYVHRDTVLEEDFLKTIYKSDYFVPEEKEKWVYKLYLGKTICETPSHYLNGIEKDIGEYKSIEKYKDKIDSFFGNIEVQQFKACFKHLKKNLYIEDEENNKIISSDDAFLGKMLEIFEDGKEMIFGFNKELEPTSEEDISEENKRKDLFTSGKIVIKRGDNLFILSNKTDDLYTSTVIKNKSFIIEEPSWAYKYIKNLDKKIEENDFFKTTNLDRLKEIMPTYINSNDDKKGVKKTRIYAAIKEYLETIDAIGDKEIGLFNMICTPTGSEENSVTLTWKAHFFSFISDFNKKITKSEKTIFLSDGVRFSFDIDKLSDVPQYMREKIKDRIDVKNQEEEFRFMGEDLSIMQIINQKVKIYKDQDGNKRRYTIGKAERVEEDKSKKDSYFIIVFGEESFGNMLNELFNCKDYITPYMFTTMDVYLPNPLLNSKFDTWTRETLKDIKCEYTDDKKLKEALLNRFECKESSTWYCFNGYGAATFETKKCPICGSVLIAEASSLHIRSIQAVQGLHVPILLCTNCNEAIKYTDKVYLCNKEGEAYTDKESLKEKLLSENVLKICFDMFSSEKKYFDLEMTFLHFKVILNLLE